MLCCSSKEKEAARQVYISMYPNLPIFSYTYIVENYYPSRYLRGFFGIFTEFWLVHKDFLPDVFEHQELYNLIDTKWKEYCKFIDTTTIDYRLQLIVHGDENSREYEETINYFWKKQTSQNN